MQRLLPPYLTAAIAVMMAGFSFAVPDPALPTIARLVGLPVLLAGLVLTVGHARLFAGIGTNIMTFNDPDQLVRSGAFSWTRNPMYLGFVVMLVGIAIMLGAAVGFVGPAIFFLAADRWYIPFEEERMSTTFGDQYLKYQGHVRRWIGATR